MPRLGVHNSTNGGLLNVIKEIKFLKTNTTQFFINSPRSWNTKKIEKKYINDFLKLKKELDIKPVVVHSSYLISPLSKNQDILAKSFNLIKWELENSNKIADYYVIHIRENRQDSIEQNIENINIFFKKLKIDLKVKILLENSASGMASNLSNLLKFYNELKKNGFVAGLCLDTAHLFEGGYDITSKKVVLDLIKAIKQTDIIKLIHLNDSKTKLSSKVDRHYHIGKGEIGINGFKNFLSFKEFMRIPMILETPKKDLTEDIYNLNTVKTEILNIKEGNL